jgi:hypothetical protein
VSCLKTNCSFSSGRVIAGVAPDASSQADNNRRILSTTSLTVYDVLDRPSQHDRPATAAQGMPQSSREMTQTAKGVSGERRWLRRRSLASGARPLLLPSSLLTFLGFPLSPSLLGNRHFWRRIDFLCVRPDACASSSAAAVSPTCYNPPLVGLLASTLRLLLAAVLVDESPHSQLCLEGYSSAGMGLGESPRSRTR